MKTATKFICPALAALALVCFALLSTAQAVTPPPDGGYPGGNTAEGDNALLNVNTAVGVNNTAVGFNALRDNTTGAYNVAIGEAALANNTSGFQNMAIGTEALANNNANFNLAIGFRVLFMNTTGNHLTGIGAAALRNNTTGGFNTAIGADALRENTIGENNTAIGADALSSNITGRHNTAVGSSALFNNLAPENTAIGADALKNNTTGGHNTAVGRRALAQNIGGGANTANGFEALFQNHTGSLNTAMGQGALLRNNADGNTAIGVFALMNNTGELNTAVGLTAFENGVGGSQNTAIGWGALSYADGDGNTALGAQAGNAVRSASNVTCIGANVLGANVSSTTWIGNVYGVITRNAMAAPVIVSADGQLGTAASSERFKKDIATINNASEAILSLRPVTFHYKTDTKGTPQFGLIAEEVAKVNPALVLPDKEGKPYTVRYDAVNTMLLNEFLKEHRKVQELETTAAQQAKEMQDLRAAFKNQAAQIEKVSAQLAAASPSSGGLETSRPLPQVVVNK
jgi:trimeric autotransporter adhesin